MKTSPMAKAGLIVEDVIDTPNGVGSNKVGVRSLSLAAGTVLLLNATWQPARADGIEDWTPAKLSVSGQQPPQGAAAVASVVDSNAVSNFIAAWQARAEQVRANQPAWSSPLVTTTGIGSASTLPSSMLATARTPRYSTAAGAWT